MSELKIVDEQTVLQCLVARIERLEELARLNGDMCLFTVDTDDNRHYLIAGHSFETVASRFPNQVNIIYVGRASSQYDSFRILRAW